MKVVVRKVYVCEYCERKMLAAGPMARHEKYCPSRPSNKHKCFDFCRYLLMDSHIIHNGDGEPSYRETTFTCAVNGQNMYSYKLEKKASLFPYHDLLSDLTRMPLECDKHESMHDENY
jgi:hypothetical protein